MPHRALRSLNIKVIATLTIVALITGVAAFALSVGARAGRTDADPQAQQQQQQQQASERVEVEHVLLRENGFEPTQITRPAGRFLLAVDNRTGIDEVEFRLEREQGERLREVHLNRRGRGWREPISLSHGTYKLTEVNHPEWVCRLTISN